jgi:hypothetical protein
LELRNTAGGRPQRSYRKGEDFAQRTLGRRPVAAQSLR